jgi:ECF sigma factor
MRRTVVVARDRKRLKRVGRRARLETLDRSGAFAEDPDLVLSLDELLTRLRREDASATLVAHAPLLRGISFK